VVEVVVDDLVRSWRDEIARLDPRLRGLETFAFTDELGYFDDEVPAAGVPRRIAELFA
jgi:hypothetical protein